VKPNRIKKLKNNHSISNGFVNDVKNYSIRIGERLYRRINRHIQLLKRLNHIQNKQNWIEKAILEKLEREEEQSIAECISPEKHLSFKIHSQINVKIERSVEVIKKLRGNFSKKQWILEAIYEKLDMEEKEIEKKSKELFKTMLKESSESSTK
jgi:hypothetical protein